MKGRWFDCVRQVYLTPERVWLANAGDSRAIMCRKGRAVQISRDHKSDSVDEKRRIQALHGFITEDRRVNGVLALSRALGDTEQQPHVTSDLSVCSRASCADLCFF